MTPFIFLCTFIILCFGVGGNGMGAHWSRSKLLCSQTPPKELQRLALVHIFIVKQVVVNTEGCKFSHTDSQLRSNDHQGAIPVARGQFMDSGTHFRSHIIKQ